MTVGQFFRIVEIRTKIIGISSFTLGTLYALYAGNRFRPGLCLLMFFAVVCIDMGTTAFNAFFDYYRGVDDKSSNLETDKVLVHDGVPPGYALLTGTALFAAAAVPGFIIAWKTSWWVLAAGAASMGAGFFYNGGPKPISRTPFGELFAGGFLGMVLYLLSFYIQSGRMIIEAVLTAIPSTIMISSILTVNNTCDIEGDRTAGRRTLSILLGPKRAPWAVYSQGFAAYLVLLALPFAGLMPRPLLFTGSAAAVLSAAGYILMHRRGYGHRTKGAAMRTISRIFLFFTAGFASALIITLL